MKRFLATFLIGSAVWGAQPDVPLDFKTCVRELNALAVETLGPDLAAARTLGGAYTLPFLLVYRLRSFFEVSNGLATKLVLTPEGLPLLIRSTLGETSDGAALAKFDVLLVAEEKKEWAALAPLLRADNGMKTLCGRYLVLGEQLFPNHSQFRRTVAGDPTLLPLVGMLLMPSNPATRAAAQRDFDARYSAADQGTLGGLVGQALRNVQTRASVLDMLLEGAFETPQGVSMPKNRAAFDVQEYVNALLASAGYTDVKSFNAILIAAYKERFGHLKFGQGADDIPFWHLLTHPLGADFSLAFLLFLKGRDVEAQRWFDAGVAEFRTQLPGMQTMAPRILQAMKDAIADPRFRLLALGEFIGQGKVSPEHLFASMLASHIEKKEKRAGVDFYPYLARPHLLSMVKAALLYAYLSPGTKILEIGYEKPIALSALRYYCSHTAGAVGVDVLAPPAGDVAALLKKQQNIDLLQGNPPHDAVVTQQIAKLGPYGLIYGLDVFRATYGGYGADFDPKVPMATYLKWVADSLTPGGVFLILNDNKELPNFTLEQAKAAGLTLVRWAEDWSFALELNDFFPLRDKSIGNLLLYVFRKGEPPPFRPGMVPRRP